MKAPPMNTLAKLTALKAGDTDAVLAGSKYERCTAGDWKHVRGESNTLDTKDSVVSGDEIICDNETCYPAAISSEDAVVIADAKRNAALCAVQREVIAELVAKVKHARGMGYTQAMHKLDEAIALAKQLEDL